MSIYSDLLFQHGHIANAELARSLAAPATGSAANPAAEPDSAAAAPAAAADAAPTQSGEPSKAAASRRHRALLNAITALSPFR